MKKLIFCTLALIMTANVFAITPEELKGFATRLIKVQKFVEVPKPCGLVNIDKLAATCGLLAANSAEITPILQNMYYHSLGQSVDGVADVTVKKPTLAEAAALSVRIASHGVLIANAVESVEGAVQELKTIKNPLQLKNPTSCVNYSKDVLKVLGEESVAQGKAIGEIVNTLKNSNNL